MREKIFQSFYRVEGDRYREDRIFGGTILGLHICKQIIEAHDGKIHVDSELDEGTTLTVELPKNPKKLK